MEPADPGVLGSNIDRCSVLRLEWRRDHTRPGYPALASLDGTATSSNRFLRPTVLAGIAVLQSSAPTNSRLKARHQTGRPSLSCSHFLEVRHKRAGPVVELILSPELL